MEIDKIRHKKAKPDQAVNGVIDNIDKAISKIAQLASINPNLMWMIIETLRNARNLFQEYRRVSSDINETFNVQHKEAIHAIYGRLLDLKGYKLFSIFTALSRKLDPNPLLSKPLPVVEVKVETADEFGRVREVTNAFYTWTPLKPRLFDNGVYFTILPLQNMRIVSWSKNSMNLANSVEKSIRYPECERLPSRGDENVCKFERLPYLCVYVGKNAKSMCENNKWCLSYVRSDGKKYEKYAVYVCFTNYEGQRLHFIAGGDVVSAESGAMDLAAYYCKLGYFISSSYYLNLRASMNKRCPLIELMQLSNFNHIPSMDYINLQPACKKCISRGYRYLSSRESLLRLVKVVPRISTNIQFHETSDIVKLYNDELIAIFSEKGQLCEKIDSIALVLNSSKFPYVDINEYEANLQVKPGYCVETKTLALLWSEEYLRKTINRILLERPYTRKWLAYKLALQLLIGRKGGHTSLNNRENFLRILAKDLKELKDFINYFEDLLKSGLDALDKEKIVEEIPCLLKFIKTKYGGKLVGLLKMEVRASDYIIWSIMEALSQVIVNVYAALTGADPENFVAVPVEFYTVNSKCYYGVALAERAGGGLGYLEAFWKEVKHDKEHVHKLLLNTIITLMLEEIQFTEYLVKELGKIDSIVEYENKVLERIEKTTKMARAKQYQKMFEILRRTTNWITALSRETGLYPPIPIWIAQLYLAKLASKESDEVQELIKELAYTLFQLLHHCWDGCPNCIAQDRASIDNLICRSKYLLVDLIAYTLKDMNISLSDVDYELALILGPLLLLAQKKLAIVAPCISKTIEDMLTTLKLFRPELNVEIKRTKIREHVKAYIIDDILVITGSVNPTVKGLHENVESITMSFGKRAVKIEEKLRKLIT
ncbi:MAG TPA: hypothetical protein EYH26_00310 [Pyrodictium sp.]|nr:hypothetical protein [Pyrodictium sp.]